jgi:uncharacterized flavoprotein (TIGR03862 family)
MQHLPSTRIAIVGGGPAGLMAAETARAAGCEVDLFDAKGSVGRKFLIAGKGGLNLTHSEPFPAFVARFREATDWVEPWLREFDADALRAWARGLGVETRVGSSGRVFPTDLKAAPLLRGWVRRLREQGVRFHMHQRWIGWNEVGELQFATEDGDAVVRADSTVLALGGASWPELGSDGTWTESFARHALACQPLRPANCGFDVAWSEHFIARHAGAPLKPARVRFIDAGERAHEQQGEFIVTAHGVEGSLIYALAASLRDSIDARGSVDLILDLAPDRSVEQLAAELATARGKRSLSDHLRRHASLSAVKIGLLHECLPRPLTSDAQTLASAIKALPITLQRTRPIAEAISSAGGVPRSALDDRLMLRARPGVFCAGEMLDWEAPTGGYLLTACFASGRRAAHGAIAWLRERT